MTRRKIQHSNESNPLPHGPGSVKGFTVGGGIHGDRGAFPSRDHKGAVSKEHIMALLERVATLVRANLNDLIDKAEDPEKMIKQVIHDMQYQLLQVKTQVTNVIAAPNPLVKKPK